MNLFSNAWRWGQLSHRYVDCVWAILIWSGVRLCLRFAGYIVTLRAPQILYSFSNFSCLGCCLKLQNYFLNVWLHPWLCTFSLWFVSETDFCISPSCIPSMIVSLRVKNGKGGCSPMFWISLSLRQALCPGAQDEIIPNFPVELHPCVSSREVFPCFSL